MTTLSQIDDFLADKELIVAGASSSPKKFGAQIFKSLHENDFELVAVNPNSPKVLSYDTFAQLSDVPYEGQNLFIVTPKDQTDALIREAAQIGVRKIWIQQGAETKQSREIAESFGITVIEKKCLFMFLEPVESIHKFHRGLSKLFGVYPKG